MAFVFGGWVFDITAAAAIIHAERRETVSLPVEPWARAYGPRPRPRQRTDI